MSGGFGLTRQSIDNLFRVPSLQGNQSERYEQLRTQTRNLALLALDLSPSSREQSEAINRLVEFLMWEQQAMMIHETQQTGRATGD